MSVENVLRVWERADEIDLREGMQAYERYNATMQKIAAHFDRSLESVVGAFAALSPNNDYVGNLRSLMTLLRAQRRGDASAEHSTVSTYNACRDRAWRCLQGEDFLLFTKGEKTRNFYQNIMTPEALYPVTIDGHMISLWHGRRMTMKEAVYVRVSYETIARDVRAAAFKACVRPNQVQSVCWFVWKRVHNVVFKPQLNLFMTDDQWGLLVENVESLRSFS